MYPLVIYEKALMPHEFPRMLADAAEAGYDGFEISIDESEMRLSRLQWTDRDCACVAEAARLAGVRLQSICFSGQRRFPMGSHDPAVVDKSLDMMRRCIALASALGVRVLQVTGYDVFYEKEDLGTMARYCDNLARSADMAAAYGVMLAIEPVEKGIKSVMEALSIIHKIDSPWLQVYPDVANMASLGIDPVPEMLLGKGHIVQVHIRDALPDYFYGVNLGQGILDFEGVFHTLEILHYSGPCTIEMWNLENEDYMQIITNARYFMQKKIAAAGELSKVESNRPYLFKEVNPYV